MSEHYDFPQQKHLPVFRETALSLAAGALLSTALLSMLPPVFARNIEGLHASGLTLLGLVGMFVGVRLLPVARHRWVALLAIAAYGAIHGAVVAVAFLGDAGRGFLYSGSFIAASWIFGATSRSDASDVDSRFSGAALFCGFLAGVSYQISMPAKEDSIADSPLFIWAAASHLYIVLSILVPRLHRAAGGHRILFQSMALLVGAVAVACMAISW